MSSVRLALIGPDGVVETVIEAPPGAGPEFATQVLGLIGNWVPDPFVQAGPGSLYVPETGEFLAPDLDLPDPEETP